MVSGERSDCVVDAIEFTEKNFPQNCDELIDHFITKYPCLNQFKVKQIYNFINKLPRND